MGASELMEMIAMPSVLLLRRPCWLSEARVNTQSKGTSDRHTLCQNSFEKCVNIRIDFTQNFVTKLCCKGPVNPMKRERKLTNQIYIVESYAVESYKWKYQNWIYIVESYKNEINIVDSYKSQTVWTDTHFARQDMTTFNRLNIWSPAKGAKIYLQKHERKMTSSLSTVL